MHKALILAALIAAPAHATNLGPEEVANGSFDTSSDWAGYGWGLNPAPIGLAYHNEGAANALVQNVCTLSAGKTYRVTYTVSGSTGSTNPIHWVRLRGDSAVAGPVNTGDGVFTVDLVAPARVYGLEIRPGSGFAGVLDDVSVREVLP